MPAPTSGGRNTKSETRRAVQRYRWDTPEYADAFATLLRSSGERVHVYQVLREILSRYPRESRAVDWGAGSGDLTRLLLERCREVYAVEPSPAQRALLAAHCPGANILDGTIMSTILPNPVEVGLISHVYYHVPDHQWGAYTIRAANALSAEGVLIVILNDPDAGSNQMLEQLGAPRFDIYASTTCGAIYGMNRRSGAAGIAMWYSAWSGAILGEGPFPAPFNHERGLKGIVNRMISGPL